jgi:hypothetical protein
VQQTILVDLRDNMKSRVEFKVINYTELRPQDGKQIPAEDFAASDAGSDVS